MRRITVFLILCWVSVTMRLVHASDVLFADPCELSMERVNSLFGYLKKGWEAGQITRDDLSQLRDGLLGTQTSGHDEAGSGVERRMRARVLSTLSRSLSPAEREEAIVGLKEMMAAAESSTQVRERVEEQTAMAHERLKFVPVRPGRTVATYYARIFDTGFDSFAIKGRVTRPFWVSETLVTRGQWQAVMGWLPKEEVILDDPEEPITDIKPQDMVEFLLRLNQYLSSGDSKLKLVVSGPIPGRHFVLPTNAQRALFLDQWPESRKNNDRTRPPLGELVRDLVLYRNLIPMWTVRNPLFLDEHSRTGNLTQKLSDRNNKDVHLLYPDWRNPDIGFRIAIEGDGRGIWQRLFDWLGRRGRAK